MKYLFILLIFFVVGCRTFSIYDKTITDNEIEQYFLTNKIKIGAAFLVHTNFVVPNGEWLARRFQPEFKKKIKIRNIEYDTNVFNCVGFSGEATQIIKQLCAGKDLKAGVAWGEVYFDNKEGIRHCVNFLFLFKKGGKLQHVFFEPQVGEFMMIDLKEIDIAFLRFG